jgi:protease-4
MHAFFAAAVVMVAVLSGCSPFRFVVEAVPARDDLTETVVLGDDGGGAKVALIEVSGMIIDAEQPGLLSPGENPAARFVESLRKARDDSRVRAVVIRLNSPGGTVAASDLLYEEVRHFRAETGKPVVVLMADVAASGAYYLACAGDEVIAAPTSITGSIGVIMQTVNFAEGMRKIGIRADAITSGPNKAMGSPFEPMPAEHRQLLQDLVNEFYARFRGVVVSSRPGISEADIDWVTDGRVVSGARAAEIGLVDRTGDLRDAFDAAKTRAGVASARLVKYHRPVEYVGSPYSGFSGPSDGDVNLINFDVGAITASAAPQFLYLWDPSAW